MSKPVIIVIDDDPTMPLILRRLFDREGWGMRAANSVAAAREQLHGEPWDIVVLDRGLPDGDGVALCREIRAAFPYTYILMLTSESSDSAKLEGFDCGADDYVTKPFQIDELVARVKAGLRIVRLQNALLASNRRLEELAVTDGLTSLRNRRAYDEHLQLTFEQSRRYERPLSLALVDIDHFKKVNDTRGHAGGDAVLRAVADLLAQSTRAVDFVARIGGEEFAILLPETALAEALLFAERVRARIAEAPHGVTASFGIAAVPNAGIDDAEALHRAADEALYRAKELGRNRVERAAVGSTDLDSGR